MREAFAASHGTRGPLRVDFQLSRSLPLARPSSDAGGLTRHCVTHLLELHLVIGKTLFSARRQQLASIESVKTAHLQPSTRDACCSSTTS
jgi:hypothetical protein